MQTLALDKVSGSTFKNHETLCKNASDASVMVKEILFYIDISGRAHHGGGRRRTYLWYGYTGTSGQRHTNQS